MGKVGRVRKSAATIQTDAIELPMLHTDLFQKFHHATRGFCLRSTGLRKTLIGKATAYNLTKQKLLPKNRR